MPTPSYAYYTKYGVEIGGANIEEPYSWSSPTVSAILENEAYLGNTVNFKYTTLIKRIEVGVREKKYSRNAPQDITIYYRDVGAMDELPQQRAEEEESAKNSQEIA